MERVHEILRRDVPRRVRREGAAAEAADRRIEHGCTRVERRERVRIAGVSRVVEVTPDRDAERRDTRGELANRSGRRDADGVREDESVGVGLGDASGDLENPLRIDLSLERAAERDAQRHGRAEPVLARARHDAAGRRDRLLDGRALVPFVERLGDAEGEPHLVEPGRDEPLVAALVECEPGAHDSRHLSHRFDDLLRVRHLRDPPRVDEARDLDRRHAGADELPDELDTSSDVEDLRLVLQTVARADVVHGHSRRGHGRGHLTRPGPR